jgi:hypothetical protein
MIAGMVIPDDLRAKYGAYLGASTKPGRRQEEGRLLYAHGAWASDSDLAGSFSAAGAATAVSADSVDLAVSADSVDLTVWAVSVG